MQILWDAHPHLAAPGAVTRTILYRFLPVDVLCGQFHSKTELESGSETPDAGRELTHPHDPRREKLGNSRPKQFVGDSPRRRLAPLSRWAGRHQPEPTLTQLPICPNLERGSASVTHRHGFP